jgi:hypothetical protein
MVLFAGRLRTEVTGILASISVADGETEARSEWSDALAGS